VQFHGKFEEIPFSTVTSPPTAQYKVTYHIYAGRDQGAYYQVYIKNLPASSFYRDAPQRRIVATGYIGAGEYATASEDFVAPSGYKEMCIVVNGQEECGFKQVTTSFAVDYVTEMYVASQANNLNITSEAECIGGSPNLFSLLNTQVLEGVEEATVNPAIYNRGVIRVCATDDPGSGTDPKENFDYIFASNTIPTVNIQLPENNSFFNTTNITLNYTSSSDVSIDTCILTNSTGQNNTLVP